jgi:uncharacterized protein DUF5666
MSGLATITTIVKSKAALAVLGAILVGGTGTAAAVAATTGHLGPIQTPGFAHSTPGTDQGNGDHAHTISIEGILNSLKACPSSVTQLVVTKASESTEHDVQANDSTGDAAQATHAPEVNGTKTPEKTETPESGKPATTGTETLTVLVDSKTKVNGEHATTLADLCGNTGHRVQVQAEKGTDGTLTAWKVTLQGADGSGNNAGGTGDQGSQAGQDASVSGTVASVNSGKQTFILTTADGKTVTITVSAKTTFAGAAHGLSGLHAGQHVTVQGTRQSDGSIVATRVE